MAGKTKTILQHLTTKQKFVQVVVTTIVTIGSMSASAVSTRHMMTVSRWQRARWAFCWSNVDRLSTCTELVGPCDVLQIYAASASPSSHAHRNVTSETDDDASV